MIDDEGAALSLYRKLRERRSPAEAVATLERQGYLAPNGKPWTEETLSQALRKDELKQKRS